MSRQGKGEEEVRESLSPLTNHEDKLSITDFSK
jgi:hypothetical protein